MTTPRKAKKKMKPYTGYVPVAIGLDIPSADVCNGNLLVSKTKSDCVDYRGARNGYRAARVLVTELPATPTPDLAGKVEEVRELCEMNINTRQHVLANIILAILNKPSPPRRRKDEMKQAISRDVQDTFRATQMSQAMLSEGMTPFAIVTDRSAYRVFAWFEDSPANETARCNALDRAFEKLAYPQTNYAKG